MKVTTNAIIETDEYTFERDGRRWMHRDPLSPRTRYEVTNDQAIVLLNAILEDHNAAS